jgi:26S proteasome regulatory subunit N1
VRRAAAGGGGGADGAAEPAGMSQVDAGRNLAATFVNAFVNAGFRRDKLLIDDASPFPPLPPCLPLLGADGGGTEAAWIHQHRDAGMTSATAALGMLLLWDVEAGLTHLNKYMYVDDERIRAGAFMGMGASPASLSVAGGGGG